MTAADITWDSYAWPTFWLTRTDALSVPAPAPEAEPMPIYDAALAAHLAAGGTPVIPFAERVCGTCNATGKEPCRTASGKVLRRFHVARG